MRNPHRAHILTPPTRDASSPNLFARAQGLVVPRLSGRPLTPFDVDYSELTINDHWRELSPDGTVKYFMYHITTSEPGQENRSFYKAARFIRLTRVPRYLRQGGKDNRVVFDQQRDVLAALRAEDVLYVNMIAKTPELPQLVFSYGVQAIGETPEEAKALADRSYAVLSGQLDGTYQQLEYQALTLNEAEYIVRYQNEWSHMAVALGQPVMSGGSFGGSSGVLDGNRTDAETSANQIEAFIRGMSDRSFLLTTVFSPIPPAEITRAWRNLTGRLSEIRSDVDGTRAVTAGVAIPTALGMSMGESSGQSHSSAEALGVGEAYTASQGVSEATSVTDSVSHTRGLAASETVGTSHAVSETVATTEGITDSLAVSQGISSGVGSTVGLSEGLAQSESLTRGQSLTQSQSVSESVSQSLGQSQSIGLSETHGQSASASLADTQTVSSGRSSSLASSLASNWSQSVQEAVNAQQSASEGWSEGVSRSLASQLGLTDTQSTTTGLTEGSSVNSSKQIGIPGLGVGDGGALSESLSRSLQDSNAVSQSLTNTASQSSGLSGGRSSSVGQSLTTGQTAGGSTSQTASEGISVGESRGQTATQSVGSSMSRGLTQTESVSQSVAQSQGVSRGLSLGESLAATEGLSRSQSLTQSMSQNQSVNSSQSLGQALSRSVSSAQGVTQAQSQSTTATQSVADAVGRSLSQSQGVNAGTSQTASATRGLTDAYLLSQGRTAQASSSLGLIPSVGISISRQTHDARKKHLADILATQVKRYQEGIEAGAFLYQMVLQTEDSETLFRAAGLLKSAFWGSQQGLLYQPFRVITGDELVNAGESTVRLLAHNRAFSLYRRREPDAELIEPFKFSSYITPGEAAQVTHPPITEAPGLLTQHDSMPVLAMPSNRQDRGIDLGYVVNGERGIVSDIHFGVDSNELVHTLLAGSTGSGKTSTLLKMMSEAVLTSVEVTSPQDPNNPLATPESKQVYASALCLDWQRNLRKLADVVPPDRFRFFSVVNPELGQFRWNPLAIPTSEISADEWVNALADQFMIAFDLGEYGRSLIQEHIRDLYSANRLEPYILKEPEVDNTGTIVSPGIMLPPIDRTQLPPEAIRLDAAGQEYANVYTYGELSRLLGVADLAIAVRTKIHELGSVEAGRAHGTEIRNRYQSLWRRLQYFAPDGSLAHVFGADPSLEEVRCLRVPDIVDPDRGLVTVIEADGLDMANRRLVLGIVFYTVWRYGQAKGEGVYDQHGRGPGVFVCMEEAHELFGTNGGSEDRATAQARESIYESMYRRARALGLKLIAVVQNPAAIPPAIYSNTSTVIVHRLTDQRDREVIASLMNWNVQWDHRREMRYLGELPRGWSIIRMEPKESYLEAAPVQVKIDQAHLRDITDARLRELSLRSN